MTWGARRPELKYGRSVEKESASFVQERKLLVSNTAGSKRLQNTTSRPNEKAVSGDEIVET